ncbi:MAG TPA: hypothetical protein VGO00_19025 [Kofleriaceae bacterium]|nr:hypothetical protein [Kofleriaceae bacterium]
MRVLAVIVLAGCFDPRLTAHLPCAQPDSWCPPPQTCRADGLCAGGTVDAAADASLPEANIVFTSSEPINADNLSNDDIVTMADHKCQALGTKLRPGTYIAWLATDPGSAATRLPGSVGWARADGRAFTTSAIALGSQNQVLYPPRLDDDGVDIVGLRLETPVVTELPLSDGCMGTNTTVVIGSADATAPEWLDNGGRVCDSDLFLYCFETDRTSSFIPPPVLDPDQLYAFVTNTDYALGNGIGELDTDCQTAAIGAGLGTRTFRAFVAPTGAAAQSRFQGSAKSWSRLDGVVVADRDLTELIAPISTDETGTQLNADVAFGANSPTTPGTDATNCTSWGGPTTVETSLGHNTRSSAQAFSGSSSACTSAHLYCLETP